MIKQKRAIRACIHNKRLGTEGQNCRVLEIGGGRNREEGGGGEESRAARREGRRMTKRTTTRRRKIRLISNFRDVNPLTNYHLYQPKVYLTFYLSFLIAEG